MKNAFAFAVLALIVAALSLRPLAQQAPQTGAAQQPAPAGGGRAGGLGSTYGLGGWNENPAPTRKVVLAWADRGTERGHSATSHALSVIERLGYESGLWETEIQTTSQFITLGQQAAVPAAGAAPGAGATGGGRGGGGGGGGFNLRNVDAIFAMGGRPASLTDAQKADLLTFVRNGGGFVASHTGLIQFSESWPEYKDMLGGFHEGHPFNGAQTPGYLVNEDPTNPIVKHIPREWLWYDEYYMIRDFDRTKAHVLLRMDVSKLPEVHAFRFPSNDFPVAWIKDYGKGRVFYSTLAHGFEGWDNSNVQRMYLEALKWATHQSEVDATPRPMQGTQAPPKTTPVPKGGQNPAGIPCAEENIVVAQGQQFCFEGPLPKGEGHATTAGGRGAAAPAGGRGGNAPAAGRGGN